MPRRTRRARQREADAGDAALLERGEAGGDDDSAMRTASDASDDDGALAALEANPAAHFEQLEHARSRRERDTPAANSDDVVRGRCDTRRCDTMRGSRAAGRQLLYSSAHLMRTRRFRQRLGGDHNDWRLVKAFFERGPFRVNEPASALPALIDALLADVRAAGLLTADGAQQARDALLTVEHGSVSGHSSLILLAQVRGTALPPRVPAALAGAHLARPATLISSDQRYRNLVLAIAPPGTRARHRLLSVAAHVGSVLVDTEFRADQQSFATREDVTFAFGRFEKRGEADALGAAADTMRCNVAARFAHLVDAEAKSASGKLPLLRLFRPRQPLDGDDQEHDHELAFSRRFAGGLVDDVRTRFTRSLYSSDWLGVRWKKTLVAAIYMYIATVVPTIAFGGLLGTQTGGFMALSEIMLTQSVVGLVFALLGGNVLAILRPSGPVVAFIALVYSLSVHLHVDFLKLWAWVVIWLVVWLLVVAVSDLSVLIRYVTEFTEDVFSALISTLFIYTALKHAYGYLAAEQVDGDKTPNDVAVFSLVLLFLSHFLAVWGANFRTTPYLSSFVRKFIHVISGALALIVPTVLAVLTEGKWWGAEAGLSDILKLEVPRTVFQPSIERNWWIRFWEFEEGEQIMVAHAFYLGFLLAALFFVEQNIANELMAAAHMKLRKPITFHWDMLVAALLALFCGLLGLPVAHTALPHSVMHVHALAREEYNIVDGVIDRHILRVEENRWSAFLISLLILLSILVLPYLDVVPLAAVYGLFLYMGWSTLTGNPFFLRIKLW